ncbi:MAG TPA: aldehyde dehydrogenase family protein, partial [Phycisphaerae bacterium]|nr:aldehyde dehydrogenase family protein [Phycisphaerae bacterium]
FERPPVLKFERGELIMDPFENVPNTDFAHEDNRRRMLGALEQARGRLGREQPLLIDGQPVVTGQWFESVNPSRPAEVVRRVARADAAAVERAVRAATAAFESWRRSLPQQRAEHLLEAARLMQRARFDLAALLALECAKPWREADAEVSTAIDYCNYYAREFVRLGDDARRRDLPGETNEYGYAGRGVAAVIAPSSAPLAALAGMTAAAVVTGNTVVMKPASAAPVVAARLVEILEQAGLPSGVANYVPGPGDEVGELLAAHPGVCTIAFAGSPDAGARVYRLAAEHPCEGPGLKRVIAAMGGKNAIIVDSDADMDDAIKGVLSSAFAQAGQRCSACARCVVLEAVYERFVDRLVEAARGLSVGPADDPRNSIPPLVDADAQRRVREYVEAGKREARCVLETDVRQLVEQTGGYFVGPTIFADVPPAARLAREPVPGPVLAILPARDFDHAIELFNASGFALVGGVYSRSPANLERARADCRCGNLYINRRITGERVDAQPFGGQRLSGLGAHAGGPDYLVQFCEARTITENTLRRGFAPAPSAEGLEAISEPG